MTPSFANGGASWDLGLKILRVQGKRGRTDVGSGLGRPAWADRARPIPARLGRPFAPVGPQVIFTSTVLWGYGNCLCFKNGQWTDVNCVLHKHSNLGYGN
jgi:hypothetical protein